MINNHFEPVNLTINYPQTFDMKPRDLQFFLVAKLYEAGKISFGQGAEMLNVSKRTFIESLGIYNVSIFENSTENLLSDIENA